MEKKDLRIVFMGTPDFAVGCLRTLVEEGYKVVGVVTMPDKPIGRGLKMQSSAVKKYAEEQNIPLLQPVRLKDENFLSALKAWRADLQIVVAFRMLPEIVWAMPPMGTFNLHASLLPQYRGAAPINWAIINGEQETGVTTFFLSHEIDTGAILFQEREPIYSSDTVETLHDRLMEKGARLICKTIEALLSKNYTLVHQEELTGDEPLHSAPKLFKENCTISWDKPVQEIYNFVRGLSPYPAANALLHIEGKEDLPLKIYEVEAIFQPHSEKIGTLSEDDRGGVRVAVQGGYIKILSLQPAGKRRMKGEEWLKGFRFLKEAHW